MKIEKVPAKTKTVVTVVEPEKFVVELTREEAEALKLIHGKLFTGSGPIGQISYDFYCKLEDLIPGWDDSAKCFEGDGREIIV